jgi:hypothetical protein
MRATLAEVMEIKGRIQAILQLNFAGEGNEKPSCLAEAI